MASLILNFGAKLKRVVSLRTRCPVSIELEAGWVSGPVCSHWRRETFLLFAGKVMELCYLDPPSRSIVTDYEISCLASFMGAEDHNDRSQWPRGLMCRSATSRLLGLRVRISSGPQIWVSVSVVCCQVEVSATGRSLVQRSPTVCHWVWSGAKITLYTYNE